MVKANAGSVEVAGRKRWREADARVLLEAWQGSGQTLTAFAQMHDIHPERLGRWHRLLRATHADGPVGFHPVRVRRSEPRSGQGEKIEVVLAGKRCIRVPHGFDVEDLRRLLAVLDAGL
jgi:hypothetical protein